MDYKVIEAYAKGRLAGGKYCLAKHANEFVQRPPNPFPGTAYLASVEWDRGFAEGFLATERIVALSEAAH